MDLELLQMEFGIVYLKLLLELSLDLVANLVKLWAFLFLDNSPSVSKYDFETIHDLYNERLEVELLYQNRIHTVDTLNTLTS